ncbi:MAG: ABC transporter ATP-binding protein [Chloroflexota bacterium]
MADELTLDAELEEEEDEEEEARKKPFNYGYFKRMLAYLKPYRRSVVAAGLLTLFVSAVGMAEPLLLKYAIDNGVGKANVRALNLALGILLGLRVLGWAAGRNQIRVMSRTGQNVLYDLRKNLFDHIQSLSFAFYDGRPAGKIMSRITNDVNSIGDVINAGLINAVSQAITLIGITVLMLSLHWRLALMALVVVPLLTTLFTQIRPRMEAAWMQTRKTMASINAHLNETILGLQVIQAFSRERLNSKKFDRVNGRQLKAYMRAINIELFFWPVIDVIAAIGTFLVIWYGAREVIAMRVSVGTVVAFLTYVNRFWAPLSAMSRQYSQLLSAMASAERVFEFLDTKPLVVDAEDAIELPTIAGRVEFDDVHFAYKAGEEVLHGVSFTAEPGQTIAIVGPTGAGKSTIINLVARFYDPSAGAVRIDGHDLRDVKIQSVRSQLGIVLQDTFIFSGTIRENIQYGRLEAALEEIQEAAKAANAHEFIERGGGYDTDTKERGSALSTGQRQLLAFARAILADPRILVLDEATSSIDTETEKLIQEALKRLLRGRTSFVIAHRLSTIRNADKIIVIDDGRIVEEGTHEQLLKLHGVYWRLHDTQVKLQEQALGEIAASLEPAPPRQDASQ